MRENSRIREKDEEERGTHDICSNIPKRANKRSQYNSITSMASTR